MRATYRQAWVEIDRDAIAANVAELAAMAAPAQLCAVVKADGYGHGAVAAARVAMAAGADLLAVALVEEGLALRDAGIDAPILVLSEPPVDGRRALVAAGLIPTVYSVGCIDALGELAPPEGLDVHLKVNTGMNRVGAAIGDVAALARRIAEHPRLRFDGLWTHLATADDPDPTETVDQLDRFDAVIAAVRADGHAPRLVHAANSAGTIAHPRARYDLVRCGIAVYGLPPDPAMRGRVSLRPAMAVKAAVSWVKPVRAGEGVSYGLRHRFDHDTTVATVPIGYADGVSRALGLRGGEVLIAGVRRPIVGVVTMDQLMVECDPSVQVGDEVVLLGRQGDDEIDAVAWADRLDTIAYEVVCGFGPRLPRRVV